MPICRRLPSGQQRNEEQDGWPEPPGYLGEAVRRAKQIAVLTHVQQPLPETPDTEAPP